MLDIPQMALTPGWAAARTGYELHLLAQQRSRRTILSRRSSMSLLARWCINEGITDPAEVTRAHMQTYMVASYTGRQGSGAETVFQGVKSFWAWYSAEESRPTPMQGVPRPKVKSRPVPVLRPPEIDAIFDACKGRTSTETLRNTAIVWLLLESGLRRSELTALNVADVDIKGRTVAVLHGKGNKSRVAVFGPDTAQALWRWLKARDTMAMATRTDALFITKYGKMTNTGLGYVITKVGDKAGVRLHAHMFRHAACHYQLAAGAQEGDLMQIFGWSSRVMLDRYGAELKQERAIAAALANPVGKILRGK
jgi:site-specific recombinase XerD